MNEIEFLKARLDELEAEARRASDFDDDHGSWPSYMVVQEPEFVLAQIAAQRKIIEINESWPLLVEGKVEFGFDGSKAGDYAMVMAQQIAWTTNQKYREAFGDEPPTTPVIRALIQPFSGHPDFQEEWRA